MVPVYCISRSMPILAYFAYCFAIFNWITVGDYRWLFFKSTSSSSDLEIDESMLLFALWVFEISILKLYGFLK